MLPAVHTDEELSAVVGDETILRPAAADLAARHGLAGRELRRYPAGSSPVYAVGDQHVIKLSPALPGYNGAAETRVLEFLQGRLPVATPELHAHGEYENGWRFILMSQLPGEDLAKTWPEVPLNAQDRIADEVGGLLAGLHALDPGPLTGLIGPENWAAFLVEQRATAVERQRQVRLGEAWLQQIPEVLAYLSAGTGPRSWLNSVRPRWSGSARSGSARHGSSRSRSSSTRFRCPASRTSPCSTPRSCASISSWTQAAGRSAASWTSNPP